MKNGSRIVLALILVGCTTLKDKKASYSDTTVCTRDINQWGHSSNCKCKDESLSYDQKIGKCNNE